MTSRDRHGRLGSWQRNKGHPSIARSILCFANRTWHTLAPLGRRLRLNTLGSSRLFSFFSFFSFFLVFLVFLSYFLFFCGYDTRKSIRIVIACLLFLLDAQLGRGKRGRIIQAEKAVNKRKGKKRLSRHVGFNCTPYDAEIEQGCFGVAPSPECVYHVKKGPPYLPWNYVRPPLLLLMVKRSEKGGLNKNARSGTAFKPLPAPGRPLGTVLFLFLLPLTCLLVLISPVRKYAHHYTHSNKPSALMNGML